MWMLKKCMVLLFPASCGHRKVIFTGRSSVPLREIILTVDEEIPTEQDFQELKTNALPYLSDVKSALERGWRSTTDYFFAGSTVERFGIAMMILQDARCFGLAPLGSLDADLDVMFCCSGVKASFSGQDDLLVEPYISGREGFTGYAQLVYFTPSVEKAFVSSTLNRQRANSAVQNMPVDNLTSDTCCFGTIDSGPKVSFSSRGPTMRVRVAPLFEADFTICIQCFEWPPKSDWSFRPRYWPCATEVKRIMSLGCHLVAKPAPSDKNKTSWRFSFSLTEVELTKTCPRYSEKMFLGTQNYPERPSSTRGARTYFLPHQNYFLEYS
ncbi:uncharacterized protein LOC111333269 [Stylophora pistillata]|uniref:uncharacterized protein LOC111333269 n=1 Tax=Stylophora pistillata TaxID=50429 RepID=UPI000C0565FD|nr:uncharacterized protein LOC111333269 [Stylophora pistillata]